MAGTKSNLGRAVLLGLAMGVGGPLVGWGLGAAINAAYDHCTGPGYRVTLQYRPDARTLRLYAWKRYPCPLTGWRLLGGAPTQEEALSLIGEYKKAESLGERVVATVP